MKPFFHLLAIPVVLALGLIVSACQTDPVREAISKQLECYPESRVQDIYKSFCQDNLGPGHLIPNPEQARAYLLSELKEYQEDLENGKYTKPQLRSGSTCPSSWTDSSMPKRCWTPLSGAPTKARCFRKRLGNKSGAMWRMSSDTTSRTFRGRRKTWPPSTP